MSRALERGYVLVGGAVGATALSLALWRVGRRYHTWKAHQRERLAAASRLIDTAQGAVECQLDGEGPVVLLVHGSPGGYDQGMALAHGLGLEGVAALALSRPGYRRTPLASGATPEEQADLCAGLLDTLGVAHAVVIALSGGGPAGLCYALRHPDRCRGLVMLSALSQPYTDEGMYCSLPPAHRLFRRVVDRLLGYDPFLYLLFALIPASPEPEDDAPRAFVASLIMNDRHTAGYRNDMRQFAELPAYPVQDIAVPTVIVHGTKDVDIPFAQAERLARTIPRSQLVAVDGANHVSTLADEGAVAAIRTFLRETTARAGTRQQGAVRLGEGAARQARGDTGG